MLELFIINKSAICQIIVDFKLYQIRLLLQNSMTETILNYNLIFFYSATKFAMQSMDIFKGDCHIFYYVHFIKSICKLVCVWDNLYRMGFVAICCFWLKSVSCDIDLSYGFIISHVSLVCSCTVKLMGLSL